MQIGVNYLLESKELFDEGKINFVDYFKLYSLNSDLSGFDWCIKEDKKFLMFHGIIGASSSFGDKDLIKNTNIEELKSVLQKSKTPYISGHIVTNNPNQTREETLEVIKENVKAFRDTFGIDVVLENIPDRGYYSHCNYVLEPEFISKVIYDNNINFLFDISHARKAAEFLNMTLEEYTSKLPMERAIEFHLAGMYTVPNIEDEKIRAQFTDSQIAFLEYFKEKYGNTSDYHGMLNEEDYIFLEEAVKKYKDNLKYITLEYGSYNTGKLFKDEDYTYPVANFEKVNDVIKQEVLEQLTRIHSIVDNV